jgi:hypothetical protein
VTTVVSVIDTGRPSDPALIPKDATVTDRYVMTFVHASLLAEAGLDAVEEV